MLRHPATAWILGAVLIGATAWPIFRPLADDGFPISTYPMFAVGREDRVLGVVQALWRGEGGALAPVRPGAIGVGSELQATQTISTALSRRHGEALCREIAERVAQRPERYPRADEVQLAESAFDVIAYFAGDAAPRRRNVLVRCPVPGGERAP